MDEFHKRLLIEIECTFNRMIIEFNQLGIGKIESKADLQNLVEDMREFCKQRTLKHTPKITTDIMASEISSFHLYSVLGFSQVNRFIQLYKHTISKIGTKSAASGKMIYLCFFNWESVKISKGKVIINTK